MRPESPSFSAQYAVAHPGGRERKALTVRAVIADFLGEQRLGALDVGAAGGVIDAWLAGHFGSVVGLDVDGAAIEAARAQFTRPNLRFEVGSGLALPFADDRFDMVLCMHVYEHVPDAAALLREIRRVLKPGGVCYFAAGNRPPRSLKAMLARLLIAVAYPLAPTYIWMFEKNRFAAAAQ